MRWTARMAATLLACWCGVAGAQSPTQEQDAPPPAPQRPAQPSNEAEDREATKARLERWLAETRQREELIAAALKRLEAGDSPDDVRRSLDPPFRPGRGMGGPSPMRDGPGPRDRARPDRPMEDGQPREPRRAMEAGPDRDRIVEFIERHNPELAGRIKTALSENPEMGERLLGRLAPHIREVLSERDPETRELRIAQLKNGWELMGEIRKFAELIRSGAAQDQIDTQGGRVRSLLATQFDVQVGLREREIAALEEKIARLRDELSDQKPRRETVVQERLDQIRRGATERRERHDGPEPRRKQ